VLEAPPTRKAQLTTCESKQNQRVDEEELDNVDNLRAKRQAKVDHLQLACSFSTHHAAQRDLQRSQVRVYAEQVNEFECTEDVGCRKKALRLIVIHENTQQASKVFMWRKQTINNVSENGNDCRDKSS